MRKRRIKKKTRKKASKKKRSKANSRKRNQRKTINLQQVMGFKFQTLSKAYENFKKKRETEKLKQNNLQDKEREKKK